MNRFYHTFLIIAFATGLSALRADPAAPNVKAVPTRPPSEASVIVEEMEVVDTCEADRICVDGWLYSNGAKTANNTKLKIEIGGTKHTKPRVILVHKLEVTTMAPGDRQEFSLSIPRKIPTKNKQGDEKIIEVGKYNFKLVPTWTATATKILTVPSKKK